MRIGVVPRLDRAIGGAYQYSATMLEVLAGLGTSDEFVLFTFGGESLPEGLAWPGEVVPLRRGANPLAAVGVRLADVLRDHSRPDPAWQRFFARHAIDLLLFTTESDLALGAGVPYIVAIHDIQHRLHPEFPEVSADGESERRERLISRLIAEARVVLVDSEVGRSDVLEHYASTGIDPAAVRPLPFLPATGRAAARPSDAEVEAVLGRYGLAAGYLFCPAQFWPHKNHVHMVEAIAMLAAEGLRVPLVLAGTHSGAIRERTFAEVMSAAEKAGVADLVRYLGYVPDADMPALYSGARALLFPTFFGPTNIPVLEAWAFSCPVITSDISGIREQAGDAALLVDPTSTASIASAVRGLLAESGLAAHLTERGLVRLSAYTRTDFERLLAEALDHARRGVGEGDATREDTPTPFGSYAAFYDALYADKDYEAECAFVESVFEREGISRGDAVLDLGCGTGGHALALARRGYRVTGVDRSAEMIERARAKAAKAAEVSPDTTRFVVSDLRTFDLQQRFSAAISMFAVVSYMTAEADLLGMLQATREHLDPGGVLIFDCWHGPSVLAIGPDVTVKRTTTPDGGSIERTSRPTLDKAEHTVRVDYELTYRPPGGISPRTLEESHLVRYWFAEEIERHLQASGFELVAIGPFGDLGGQPDEGDWNISVVARAIASEQEAGS